MDIIVLIALQAIEIITLVTGIMGVTFSVMLLLSPGLTKSLSKTLNRRINLEAKLDFMDKDIQIANHFYNHNVMFGLLLIGGALFSLFFFFFSLDVSKFVSIFIGTQKDTFFVEIIFDTIILIGKIACFAAVFYGLLLVFAPARIRRLESNLNSWLETKSIIEKLDNSSHELDSFIFRHPDLFGLVGAAISFLLLSLSIVNLLD